MDAHEKHNKTQGDLLPNGPMARSPDGPIARPFFFFFFLFFFFFFIIIRQPNTSSIHVDPGLTNPSHYWGVFPPKVV